MSYSIEDCEPSSKQCAECGQSKYGTVHAENEQGDSVGLCISCALEENLDEPGRQNIENTLRYELTEPSEYKEHEGGWSTDSAFGQFWVEFDTESAKAQTQVAVDAFETIGHYTKLKGRGQIHIESPKRKKTDVYLPRDAHRKKAINQSRLEEAPEK